MEYKPCSSRQWQQIHKRQDIILDDRSNQLFDRCDQGGRNTLVELSAYAKTKTTQNIVKHINAEYIKI